MLGKEKMDSCLTNGTQQEKDAHSTNRRNQLEKQQQNQKERTERRRAMKFNSKNGHV